MDETCQILPLPDYQVAFKVEGRERLRWHFAPHYPRPFFYPLLGPSGSPLTRMGHPGAPNHDHHRSIWFAHRKLLGIDFWGDQTAARIRQLQWLAYEDGEREAIMAVRLEWFDGHDPSALLTQDLIAAIQPGPTGETLLELQSKFVPTAKILAFGRTNFGFLAVRVAKQISAHFGGGHLTDSNGRTGEPAIFGRPARWMDYSGPVAGPRQAHEGITYFDHPANPAQPTHWHVRDDGWMGASPCMHGPLETIRERPLMLRYLLHAHAGQVDRVRANKLAEDFAIRPPLHVVPSADRHRQMEARRGLS